MWDNNAKTKQNKATKQKNDNGKQAQQIVCAFRFCKY